MIRCQLRLHLQVQRGQGEKEEKDFFLEEVVFVFFKWRFQKWMCQHRRVLSSAVAQKILKTYQQCCAWLVLGKRISEGVVSMTILDMMMFFEEEIRMKWMAESPQKSGSRINTVIQKPCYCKSDKRKRRNTLNAHTPTPQQYVFSRCSSYNWT